MEQIECWGCLRPFDKTVIRWYLPFAGGTSRADANALDTFAAVTVEPQEGAVPYCPECLSQIEQRDADS